MVLFAATLPLSNSAFAADIVIGMPNWTTVQAKAHILKRVIEDNFGLEVEIQTGTNAVVFEGIDKGSMHVHPEMWTPAHDHLHKKYVAERGTAVRAEKWTESNDGMCVLNSTAEAGVREIVDLSDPQKAALFDSDGDGKGEIYIGAPGWGSTPVERVRARDYGYDQTLELLEQEDAIAYARLDAAMKAGKHWVGFCSDIHFVFQKYDVRLLEEPKHDPDTWNIVQPMEDPDWLAKSRAGTAWRPATLHVAYATSLKETHPEVAALFESFHLTSKQTLELSYVIGVERQDPAAYASDWVLKNADLVADWLTN